MDTLATQAACLRKSADGFRFQARLAHSRGDLDEGYRLSALAMQAEADADRIEAQRDDTVAERLASLAAMAFCMIVAWGYVGAIWG